MPPNKKAPAVFCSHSRMVEVENIKPHPKNPNRHHEEQIRILAKVIQHRGWRNPIVVSNLSGLVIKGHCRLESAKLLGLKKVPVDFQDYESEKAEIEDLVADNRVAELSEMDNDALKMLLVEIGDNSFDMELVGFNDDALEALIDDIEATPKDYSKELKEKFEIIVECEGEHDQKKIFESLKSQGLKCRLLTF